MEFPVVTILSIICSLAVGAAFPIPTLPFASILIFSVRVPSSSLFVENASTPPYPAPSRHAQLFNSGRVPVVERPFEINDRPASRGDSGDRFNLRFSIHVKFCLGRACPDADIAGRVNSHSFQIGCSEGKRIGQRVQNIGVVRTVHVGTAVDRKRQCVRRGIVPDVYPTRVCRAVAGVAEVSSFISGLGADGIELIVGRIKVEIVVGGEVAGRAVLDLSCRAVVTADGEAGRSRAIGERGFRPTSVTVRTCPALVMPTPSRVVALEVLRYIMSPAVVIGSAMPEPLPVTQESPLLRLWKEHNCSFQNRMAVCRYSLHREHPEL